jgi:hypothetical protein
MRKRSWSGSKFTGESAYVVPTVRDYSLEYILSIIILVVQNLQF